MTYVYFDHDLGVYIQEIGVGTTTDNKEVVSKNDTVILAVKPYIVHEVLQEVAHCVHENTLFVSVAAGITLKSMEKVLIPCIAQQ